MSDLDAFKAMLGRSGIKFIEDDEHPGRPIAIWLKPRTCVGVDGDGGMAVFTFERDTGRFLRTGVWVRDTMEAYP